MGADETSVVVVPTAIGGDCFSSLLLLLFSSLILGALLLVVLCSAGERVATVALLKFSTWAPFLFRSRKVGYFCVADIPWLRICIFLLFPSGSQLIPINSYYLCQLLRRNSI